MWTKIILTLQLKVFIIEFAMFSSSNIVVVNLYETMFFPYIYILIIACRAKW